MPRLQSIGNLPKKGVAGVSCVSEDRACSCGFTPLKMAIWGHDHRPRDVSLSLSLSLSSENHRRNRLRVWPLHLRQKWSHQTIKIRSIYCHLEVQQSAWIRVAMLKSLLFMWIIQHEIHKDLGALLWSSFVRPGDHNLADGVLGWTPNWQHIAAEDVNYDSSAIQQQYTYIIHTLYIHYTYIIHTVHIYIYICM